MSEPIPPNPTVPRPPSMREQWVELIGTPHSPRRWAVIAAAIATADAAPVDRFCEPVQRGDEAWCRVAITALESPTSAAAQSSDLRILNVVPSAPASFGSKARTARIFAPGADPISLPCAAIRLAIAVPCWCGVAGFESASNVPAIEPASSR